MINKSNKECYDCKYYYSNSEYCTFFKIDSNKLNLDKDCLFYEKGFFNCRFYIHANPKKLSNDYEYILIDLDGELCDVDDNFIQFIYEDEADSICSFLNKYIKLGD